jgi:hypothetical protein
VLVGPFVLVGGAFLDCGRGLCQWASPDFELVPWVGVAGAFGEEVVGGGRRRIVGGGDRAAAAWLILKILGHLGEEMGERGSVSRVQQFLFLIFFFKNIYIYI